MEGRESIPGPHSACVTRPIVLLPPASVLYSAFIAAFFDPRHSPHEEAEPEGAPPLYKVPHTEAACSSSHKALEVQPGSEPGLLPVSQTLHHYSTPQLCLLTGMLTSLLDKF